MVLDQSDEEGQEAAPPKPSILVIAEEVGKLCIAAAVLTLAALLHLCRPAAQLADDSNATCRLSTTLRSYFSFN